MSAPGAKKSKVTEPQPKQLQRLAFVRDASILGAEYASNLYGTVKSRLPAFAKARAEKAEDLVSQIANPYYQKALDTAEALLLYTDAKADSAIVVGSDAYAKTSARVRSAVRPDVLSEKAARTRDVLVVKVQQTLTVVKENGVVGTVKLTTEQAFKLVRTVSSVFFDETSQAVNYSRATYKKAVDLTHDRASGVYNFALNKSQKVVDVAQAKTQQAHDILVKQPLYKDAYERTNTIIGAAQDTVVYKATVKRIYPYVAPVYEPTFEKIEPYYKSTVNYWKPISAAA